MLPHGTVQIINGGFLPKAGVKIYDGSAVSDDKDIASVSGKALLDEMMLYPGSWGNRVHTQINRCYSGDWRRSLRCGSDAPSVVYFREPLFPIDARSSELQVSTGKHQLLTKNPGTIMRYERWC
jgi:hypothetical protein